MKKSNRNKRLFFDLNHPADFHFFKNLFLHLTEQGYSLKVMARNKECLHDLLKHEGIPFINRGAGSHSLSGKYLYAGYILLLSLIHLVRFRPGLTISLSSPYLITASRFIGIPTLTYDDTDYNPRLLPLIRRADYVFSPATYPHTFHKNHFHLHTFKELAYLHPAYFKHENAGNAVFFRLTRTDSIHHTSDTWLNTSGIIKEINRISKDHTTFLSSEKGLSRDLSNVVLIPDTVNIHEDLKKCRVFWGNSATMAAEAAVLGIPAIFVGAEKFAYLEELEEYGLLFCYKPDEIASSFNKLDDLARRSQSEDQFEQSRLQLLNDKIDITGLLIWFIENLPESARTMKSDPDYQFQFRP